MNDLTDNLGRLYFPVKAFVLFRTQANGYNKSPCYVESYDMDGNGTPMNAHPLSIKESHALAKALSSNRKKESNFLASEGLLPRNVLYLNTGKTPFAIWHTSPMITKLLFEKDLTIPCGEAHIPALIWKADKGNLQVFAIKDKTVTAQSRLYHAPFFNLHKDGRVCMGNVQVKIPKDCSLEHFIWLWQEYFFNSYFTHLLGGFNPVSGNIIQLWQGLIDKPVPFPLKSLVHNKLTLKHLLP